MPQPIRRIPFGHLPDLVIGVEPIPRTRLVHVELVGAAAGLVLHADEAEALSRDLRRAARKARRRGPDGAGAAGPRGHAIRG
jgi:hypothetical protein